MALRTTSQNSFESTVNIIDSVNSVFVVPSFQRPFAWVADPQIEAIKNDIIIAEQREKTANKKAFHYLSPIHLVKIAGPDDDIMVKYMDQENPDIKVLRNTAQGGRFVDESGIPVDVYVIIDGQQRITTLFFIYLIYYHVKNIQRKLNFEISLPGGHRIPRLIQNPADDHRFMRDIIGCLNSSGYNAPLPSSSRQSQVRLSEAVKFIQEWATQATPDSLPQMNFLMSPNFCTALVELDKNFALTSFMTLNDRGKPLTVLEKLKSLLMEYDLNYLPPSKSLAHDIHSAFGDLYQILDDAGGIGLFPKGITGDDKIVQLLSIYIRGGYHDEAQWEDGQNAYTQFFHRALKEAPAASSSDQLVKGKTVGVLLEEWVQAIREINEQLQQLNAYLDPSNPGPPGASAPSLFYPRRTIRDDYRIILLSLTLKPASLALLLKFRALYGLEWHERRPLTCVNDPTIIEPLDVVLNKVQNQNNDPQINALLDRTREALAEVRKRPREYPCQLSMLEIVERIELYVWAISAPTGTFRQSWQSNIGQPRTVPEFLSAWSRFWYNGKKFITTVALETNETLCRYILKEYEADLSGKDIHFDWSSLSYSGLELEHVFPQTPQGQSFDFRTYGFADDEYNRFIWRSGNLTFLPKKCNISLGYRPPDLKATEYASCGGHPNGSGKDVASNLDIVRNLGRDMLPIADPRAYRSALEIRCVELAVFSLKRFLGY